MDITHLNNGKAFTAKQLANKYITESAQRSACSRMTVFANVERTQPTATITADDLADMARNPRIGAKSDAPVIAPHNGSGKKKPDAESAIFGALVMDHDDGDFDGDDVRNYYSGVCHVAFTTSSHYQDGKGDRWKCVLPLAKPMDAGTWRILSQGAADTMRTDTAQARIQQIFYAPNKLADNAPYEYLIDLESPCLALDDALGEQFMVAGRVIEAAQKERAQSASVKGAGGTSPAFQRINGRIDIASVLESHGYEMIGGRWLSPFSQSGTPGVMILDDGDKPKVYSHHGTDDPLSALNHDGHALDALDVVTVLDHGGNAKAAAEVYRADFDTLKTEAAAMGGDTDPDEVTALAAEANLLSKLETRAIFNTIKKHVGFSITDLRAAVSESVAAEDGEPDHLDLARRVVKAHGTDNLIGAEGFIWHWDNSGVWHKCEPRLVRRWVQSVLDESEEVSKSLVDSVSDLFTTEVFNPGHEFNVGPAETVNTLSGELTIERGRTELLPHIRAHYNTAQIPVEYDNDADAPRFRQFLNEVFPDDPDKSMAILEMMGYTLMRHCQHEKFIMLIGSGANGKSVLLEVIEALCGRDNVSGVQPSEFHNRFQRAGLHGQLANIVSELKQGAVIDDDALKAITSGELSKVEHKFKDPFDMRPFATCWFGTNHMPHTRDFSDALFRRALIVEFNEKFDGEHHAPDPQLKDKLKAELPGILNFAVAAYSRALDDGFTMPASSKRALREWRLEADQVAQFVEDDCSAVPGSQVGISELYAAYEEWAADSGVKRTLSKKSFRDRLTRLGFGQYRNERARFCTGIELHATPSIGAIRGRRA